MKRREFLTLTGGAVLAVAGAPLLARDDPMGVLGLIDDSTYANVIYAKTTFSGQMYTLMRRSPDAAARVRSYLESERTLIEAEASREYGRPIRFEALEFDGSPFRYVADRDEVEVLYIERPA